jgi:hypothetical protein
VHIFQNLKISDNRTFLQFQIVMQMRQMVKNENRRRNLRKLEKHMEYCLTLRREHVMTMVKILRIWKAWPVSDTENYVYRIVICTSWTIMCVG